MEDKTNQMFVCPMHPEEKSPHPGLCPVCGMKMVLSKGEEKDIQSHGGHSTNIFKARFWVSLALSVPVVAYSNILDTLFGWQAPPFPGSRYVPLVLATIIFFYSGAIFIKSALRELKGKSPGMMSLISLAILTAYIYSVVVTLAGGQDVLFWELATLITVMLLGHWMEMRAVSGAQSALKELSKLLPDEAEVVVGSEKRVVPVSQLRVGDVVFVRPGARIPADGEVTNGESQVNESAITGETRPIQKRGGDQIIAGTINGDGAMEAKVTKIGEDTFLAGVMRLVKDAQASKSNLQLLSDRAAYWLTIIAIVGGLTALVSWLLAGATGSYAIKRAVAVLVIACPHALGLAIPLVASISTTLAAQNGFLIRQRVALELARKINIVLFDKTGTLTTGQYGVEKIWKASAPSEEEVLRLAASVDSHSEHFISQAIVAEAKKRKISLPTVDNFKRMAGKGVSGKVEDKEVYVGAKEILQNTHLDALGPLEKEVEEENKKGNTIIYVASGDSLVGVLALGDVIRAESKEAIESLKAQGIKVGMITGDTQEVAEWVAKDLGIDEYFARVLPGEKSAKVKALQEKGYKVAMVGDGINDAPALTQADLGIAIGAGTNVAIESAGIILVRNDPRDIAKIIRLSRLTFGKMVQNLFWATSYNVLAIPLAGGALAAKGIVLQPAVAALLMSISTVIVAINAVLLRKKKLS